MNMSLRVVETVSSIQGEGKFTGFPTTFVRLGGCNLSCSYCDTPDKKGNKMSVERVLTYVHKMGNNHVCITGGEPLLQENTYTLIYELVSRYYDVSIETNGSVLVEEYPFKRSFSFTLDIKCPSSGESARNNYENLGRLHPNDEVKFVVSDQADYNFAKEVLKKYPTKADIIFSPVMGNGKDAHWLVESLRDDKIPKARLGVQIHKLLNFY